MIDKDALVAEIDKQKIGYNTDGKHSVEYDTTRKILDIINTLEVKDVDLEKEIETHLKDCLDVKFPTTNIELIKKDVEYTARMFFELGLQARIDKELVEEVYSHIDGIKDTADRMTSGNFMHNRAAIKFSANTIAKVLELMGVKAKKGEQYMEKYNKNDDNWVVDYRFYPEQGYCRSWLTNKKENEYR